jgi:ribonuclease R
MADIGDHCSGTERRADDATRDAVDWLKCEFMLDKVGETYAGIITSVTSFGIFVELRDIYVEGLVHVTALGNDYYHYEPARHWLMGERTRRIFRLGDEVTVKVVQVNLDDRKIDFELNESQHKRRAASGRRAVGSEATGLDQPQGKSARNSEKKSRGKAGLHRKGRRSRKG